MWYENRRLRCFGRCTGFPLLGCAFHFLFPFRPGFIFRNPQVSTDYFRFRRTHVVIKSFHCTINVFRNPPEP